MSDVAKIMRELEGAAAALDEASTKLAHYQEDFEGRTTADGEWQPGPKWLWEALVDEEATKIYDAYEEKGKRPPPESIRLSRAQKIVGRNNPELKAEYQRLKSSIEGLQKWVSAKKETISARQSVLSAEKELLKVAA